jgi:hypothetical protein
VWSLEQEFSIFWESLKMQVLASLASQNLGVEPEIYILTSLAGDSDNH